MTGDPIGPEEAVSAIRSGDTVMVGGFGLVGAPLTLIDALVEESDAADLTIVSNNIGEPGRGLGKLLRQGRIRRGISSYFTSNPEAVAAVNAGAIQATLVPQGTFAEAIRAGGAGKIGHDCSWLGSAIGSMIHQDAPQNGQLMARFPALFAGLA